MIYLDNAATTRTKPQGVIDAVVSAMQTFGNASRGAHEDALSCAYAIFEARDKIAALFHAPDTKHVIFSYNATEALNIAICGSLESGDHVITTMAEHNSVLRPLYRMEREEGVELDIVPADLKGRVDPDEIRKRIRKNTKAVVCTHASNLTGNRLDLGAIGEIAKERGLLFIVDAAQTAGAVPIDMEELGISALCFTGHKSMMGPQGTGGLCLAKDVEIRPFKVGGTGVQSYLTTQPAEYPTRLEAGTLNGHGIAGLSAAVDFLNETGIDVIGQKETGLMKRFYDGVKEIEGVVVYGDFSTMERSPIVSINIRDHDSALVADELAVTCGIATRPGAHCAPLMHKALQTESQGAVRFSFNWFNTEEEIDRAIAAVRSIANRKEE